MNILKKIEHTLLKPDMTANDVKILCEEALQHNFYGVCVPPFFVRDAVYLLSEKMKVISVAGFPLGYSTIPSKVEDVRRALDDGADEVDFVVNIAAIKSQNWAHVRNEIDAIMRTVALRSKQMKLIIEIGLLTRDELRILLPIAEQNDVHFIKTSTGFNGEGATIEGVKFLRENLSPKTKIKASGGIKTLEQAQRFVAAGADRIGTSSSVQIALQMMKK